MSTYKTKFNVGDKVTSMGFYGFITAIFIRSGISYEFTYVGPDGVINSSVVEDFQIEKSNNGKIGFNKVG